MVFLPWSTVFRPCFIFFFPRSLERPLIRILKAGLMRFYIPIHLPKFSYFFAKFASAFAVAFLVMLAIGIGVYLGMLTPGVNPDLLGPNKLAPYLKTYGVYMIPNLLFFGGIVFVIVGATRNIALGYIAIIVLFFQDALSSSYFENFDDKTWGAILDPYGFRAHQFYAEYWTVDEQNTNPLPLGKIIWFNRGFWLALSAVVLGVFYRYFKLSQDPVTLFSRKKRPEPPASRRHHGLPRYIAAAHSWL